MALQSYVTERETAALRNRDTRPRVARAERNREPPSCVTQREKQRPPLFVSHTKRELETLLLDTQNRQYVNQSVCG